MATIRHIAFFTDDPEKLAEFYVGVFGLTRKLDNPAVDEADYSSAVWLTDGYMEIALIRPGKAGTPRGINHFGFTLDKGEKDGVYQRLAERRAERDCQTISRGAASGGYIMKTRSIAAALAVMLGLSVPATAQATDTLR